MHVKVFKKDLIDLTLIDLPGLTYVKSNLPVKIKNIMRKQIQDPRCLIIMVAPSNVDIGNSETV